jgi:ArsR family transcriptional regulator
MIAPIDLFRALSDPTRLRIVALLRSMELSVGELAQVLGQSQPRVSRHVKILCDAAIATRRREGSWVFLTPGDSELLAPLFAAIDHLIAASGGDHWAQADSARLVAVRADRAAFAAQYFAAHAQEWDEIRSLHGSDAAVEAKIMSALGKQPLGRLVDVGTGTGRMIEVLAAQAHKAIGIDRSPEMLRLARAKLMEAGLDAVDLRQGDINDLPLDPESADTVILHQVLHYLPAPEVAIAKLARVTAPGGRVLIVDFAPHDLEALRDRDAHTRLGFSDAQISGWFATAGLECDLTDELPGDPLTVKIWRGTKRAPTKANA